jgi:serine/threonine-protein kinase RsbW
MAPDLTPDQSCPPETELLDIWMSAEAEAVASTTDSMMATLSTLDVGKDKCLAVGLAVQEALANAVKHGCKSDPGKTVHCRMYRGESGCLVIVITDPGPGFHEHLNPDPHLDSNLLKDHGRGIFLIRQLMDGVQFQRGGSEIKMWKY